MSPFDCVFISANKRSEHTTRSLLSIFSMRQALQRAFLRRPCPSAYAGLSVKGLLWIHSRLRQFTQCGDTGFLSVLLYSNDSLIEPPVVPPAPSGSSCPTEPHISHTNHIMYLDFDLVDVFIEKSPLSRGGEL